MQTQRQINVVPNLPVRGIPVQPNLPFRIPATRAEGLELSETLVAVGGGLIAAGIVIGALLTLFSPRSDQNDQLT